MLSLDASLPCQTCCLQLFGLISQLKYRGEVWVHNWQDTFRWARMIGDEKSVRFWRTEWYPRNRRTRKQVTTVGRSVGATNLPFNGIGAQIVPCPFCHRGDAESEVTHDWPMASVGRWKQLETPQMTSSWWGFIIAYGLTNQVRLLWVNSQYNWRGKRVANRLRETI